jgi:microcystin degradation protein MlrC
VRIFTATLMTETNTFSPLPTGLAAFDRRSTQPDVASSALWRELGERDGHTVIPSIVAVAQPAGPTVRAVYEALRGELLADLQAALPLDVVLLYLHGAMVADGYDDCEGDVLQRCRELAGERAIIGAELDLHAHLTPLMIAASDAIVLYKEYPHVDTVDRARDLYRICIDAAAGGPRPVSAVFDCRTIGMWPTTAQPMRGFVDEMRAAERDGVLSISLVHGFPYGDVPHVGTKVLAIARGDETLARETAERFGRRFLEIRDEALLRVMPLDAALDVVEHATEGPIVLADVADNAGGGAPGDSTYVLRAILDRGIARVALGTIYDPMAVDLCFEAGEGASLDLRFGGKLGRTSGEPIDARVEVRALAAEHEQEYMDGTRASSLGRSAWIRTAGVDIVLASIRTQVFGPRAFTGLGIHLEDKRAIVVKSSHHFYGRFAPLASRVIHVGAPGALTAEFDRIPYRNKSS